VNRRLTSLVAAVVVVCALGASSCAEAGVNMAVAASHSKLYLFGSGISWGGQSSVQLAVNYYENNELKQLVGTSYAGIAVRNNLVFVADQTTGVGTLHVIRIDNILGTPVGTLLRSVTLSSGSNSLGIPTEVSVDAAGNVFVLESEGVNAKYAFVSPPIGGWGSSGTPGVSIRTLSSDTDSSPIADVAAFGVPGQAIFAHQNIDLEDFAQQSFVTTSGGSGVGPTKLGENDFQPRAITVYQPNPDTYFAYVLNRLGTTYPTQYGNIAALNAATHTRLAGHGSVALPENMIPLDIAAFRVSGTGYLGIVARSNEDSQQAWRYTLDDNGVPLANTLTVYNIGSGDFSPEHQCASSEDGTIFWFTNQQSGTVIALSTSSWQLVNDQGANGHYNVEDTVRYIAACSYVPEPSSAAAFAGMMLGLASILRRKKS